ncbi:hypothetical protein GOODEAATRI_020153 [Goodea atripinnis]|uniref:Uncharacterized protein n=1 Tax=Goodea atripinnis TaxID=208336 RepID=A0ABV0PZM5_9TELE
MYRSISPPRPEPFSGDLEKSRGVLLQCTLMFQQARSSFPDVTSCISYIIGLGQALRIRLERTSIERCFPKCIK